MKSLQRRGRSLALMTAGVSLVAASLGLVTTSAAQPANAAPQGDCAEVFPLAEVSTGDAVTGLTVARGTTPAPFEGTVVGVLDDGVDIGVDMVIVDLDSPDIDKAGGIWSGMSGSPVYAEDGRLVGAVAYGLTWGSSKIAGVTPIEAMKEIGVGFDAPDSVTLTGDQARSVAARSSARFAQVRQGLTQLRTPVSLSGADPSRMARASGNKFGGDARAVAGTLSRGSSADSSTIVAGGNLGATLAHGDVTLGGVGTVTTVCRGEVIGFGHPLDYAGQVSYALHPATALFVQEDTTGSPFKVANFGAPVGTINQDRWAGISGFLGQTPDGFSVSASATLASRTRQASTLVTSDDSFYQAYAVNGVLSSSVDRAMDRLATGNVVLGWTIKGTSRNKPFTLKFRDRIRAEEDIAYEIGDSAASLVWQLADIPGVKLQRMTMNARPDIDAPVLRLHHLKRRQGGEWRRIPNDTTIKAKAGTTLRLRAALRSAEGTRIVPLAVKVPRARGKAVALRVLGGDSDYVGGRLGTLKGVREYLAKQTRNDQVVAKVRVPGRGVQGRRTYVSKVQPSVVRGERVFTIQVR